MKMFPATLVLVLALSFSVSSKANVISGTVSDVPESSNFYFGDGINDIQVFWSTLSTLGGNGWVYGSTYDSDTNADFSIVSGGVAIDTVVDASTFLYSTGALMFATGDTIFFRGLNGFYGALQIDNVYPNPLGVQLPYTYLDATWYFQNDGSANFSSVPLPAAVWLLLSGIGVLYTTSRKREQK